MTGSQRPSQEDRLFVRHGRRCYRRRYSPGEVRAGVVILAGLAAIAAWVGWRGAHPDPELRGVSAALLAGAAPPRRTARGPFPAGLAGPGWHERAVSRFDAGNLYEKIDGREDYYKSFGCERLYCLTLLDDQDPALTIDIELFELGGAAGALGAYAGERPPEVAPEVGAGGMAHLARNALFMTRGRYYVRAIGSDESPRVVGALRQLRAVLEREIEGEPLPWAYALFAGGLGLDPGRVSYMRENAFSFGFAREVYAAQLDDGATELFVVAAAGAAAAEQLAARFNAGFASYGSAGEARAGVSWIRDRYLGGFSGAAASGRWVFGVHGAPSAAGAGAALEALRAAVAALPPAVVERAFAGAAAPGGTAEAAASAGPDAPAGAAAAGASAHTGEPEPGPRATTGDRE